MPLGTLARKFGAKVAKKLFQAAKRSGKAADPREIVRKVPKESGIKLEKAFKASPNERKALLSKIRQNKETRKHMKRDDLGSPETKKQVLKSIDKETAKFRRQVSKKER